MTRCADCGTIAHGRFVSFSVALYGGTETRVKWQCTQCEVA